MLVLENNVLPGSINLIEQDPSLKINVLDSTISQSVDTVMSNSFGFGGSNCSLVFGW